MILANVLLVKPLKEMDCANLNNPSILDKTIIPGDTQVSPSRIFLEKKDDVRTFLFSHFLDSEAGE